MSVGRMRAVTLLEGLTATQKSVLFVLADFEDDSTGMCFPKLETIARCSGCCKKTAHSAIAELMSKGLLERRRQGMIGRITSNQYIFKFDEV